VAASNDTTRILKLRVICAWCKVVIHEGDKDHPVSHGICPECKTREMAKSKPKEPK
jgi:DNA-directed RNA polymerase subunit RPC12/RpoP